MNKQEFLKIWAEKAGLTLKDADKAFTAFGDAIAEGLKADKKIQFIGFGNFELKHKDGKKGVKNPLTGGTYDVEAKDVASFKFASKFNEKLN